MNLFISHAGEDLEIAQAIKIRIDELPGDNTCFILKDEILPSEDWQEFIRRAASTCDAIVCIVTPTYVGKPWFVAEWSVFWFQKKPWFLLTHKVEVEDLFEPMKGRQVARLDQWRDVRRFLTALPGSSDQNLDKLSVEIVKEVDRVVTLKARAEAEASLAILSVILNGASGDVERELVDKILTSGNIDKAVQIASESRNSVKMRQFAVNALRLGQTEGIAEMADNVTNRAERRTIANEAMRTINATNRDAIEHIVLSIYRSVNPPQKRDIKEEAERLGFEFAWPDAPPDA